MDIINEDYNKRNNVDRNFIAKVNMFDTAIHTKYGSVKNGCITQININGINISTSCGDRFVKWYHVLKVVKGG